MPTQDPISPELLVEAQDALSDLLLTLHKKHNNADLVKQFLRLALINYAEEINNEDISEGEALLEEIAIAIQTPLYSHNTLYTRPEIIPNPSTETLA